jgi:hypothetical protein
VLRPIPLYTHAGANTPAEPLDAVAPLVQRRRPSRSDNPVGLRIIAFEACSAFTRVPACVLTRSPKVTLSEGFDRFVTSTTAPAATDWSNQFVGWELHPLRIGALARRTIGRTGNAACSAHALSQPSPACAAWRWFGRVLTKGAALRRAAQSTPIREGDGRRMPSPADTRAIP